MFQKAVFSVLLFFAMGAFAFAANPQMVIAPDSYVVYRGNSTLHPYGSTSNAITVDLPLPADLALPLNLETIKKLVVAKKIKKLTVSIPVESLKSGEDGLDDNTYKTLKKEQCPEIRFQLKDYVLQGEGAGVLNLKLKGTLLIAGSEKSMDWDVMLKINGNQIWVIGRPKEILMTDYGIEPPNMMFGMIKTENAIRASFLIKLKTESR